MAARSIPRSVRLFLAALTLVAVGCSGTSLSASPTANTQASTAADSSAPPTPSPTFPLTLVDDEGTEVTIQGPPQRIVSLTPATTETLFAIGAGDRVVGKVQDIANYPPEAANVPEVATYAGVDVEQIISLGADLVVSGGAGLSQGAAVDQLRRAGVPVIVSYPTTIDDSLAGIRLIGIAVGLPDQAAALADTVQAGLDAVADDVIVFHAGTARTDEGVVTAGGRVLSVVGRGPDLDAARSAATDATSRIHAPGLQRRHDIGRVVADGALAR